MTTQNFAIFGAAGGIGSELVDQALNKGHQIFGIFRGDEKIREWENKFPNIPYAILSQGSWDNYGKALKRAHDVLGSLDSVINCIGSLTLKPIHLARENEFDATVETHLKSSAAILSHAIPFLRRSEAENKSVIMISSVAATLGIANHDLVATAKAGIEGLVRSAAATYSSAGIRINAVAPAIVDTPLTSKFCNNPATKSAITASIPLARIGSTQDIANAILWLASAESSWMTGQVLRVDGGMSSLQPKSNFR